MWSLILDFKYKSVIAMFHAILLCFIAVVQQPTPMAVHTVTVSTGEFGRAQAKIGKIRSSRIIGDGIATGQVRTGNN